MYNVQEHENKRYVIWHHNDFWRFDFESFNWIEEILIILSPKLDEQRSKNELKTLTSVDVLVHRAFN